MLTTDNIRAIEQIEQKYVYGHPPGLEQEIY